MFTLTETQARLHNQRGRLNTIANLPVPLKHSFYIPLCNYANALYRQCKELLKAVALTNYYYKDVHVLCDLLEVQIELLESYHSSDIVPTSEVTASHMRLMTKRTEEV